MNKVAEIDQIMTNIVDYQKSALQLNKKTKKIIKN